MKKNYLKRKKRTCTVIRVNDKRGTFTAQVHNPAAMHEDRGYCEVFPLEDVSPSERDLLKEGVTFYWDSGLMDNEYGQRQRYSMVKFGEAQEDEG